MKTNKLISKNLLLPLILILVTTGIPLVAQAERGDHRPNAYYFDRHDRVYTQPQHQYKRQNHHRHSWKQHHGKHHRTYNKNRGYYKHLRREHIRRHQHPKTRYNYGRNYSYNNYSRPFYAPPAQVVFGLNTANARIMLRY